MNTLKTDAIITRSQPIGEADRIITLLTKKMGKIRAVARGARRPRSRLAGSTQVFTCARCLLFLNDSLSQLSQCQIINSHVGIRTDLYRMAAASYVAELVNEMTEEQEPLRGLYVLVAGFLNRLEKAPHEHIGPLLVVLELKLLTLLGYRPELSSCVICGDDPVPGSEGKVGFSVSSGGVVCSRCLLDNEAVVVEARTVQVMEEILAARQNALLYIPPSIRDELEHVLHSFVVYQLGRELRSWEFLTSMKASV